MRDFKNPSFIFFSSVVFGINGDLDDILTGFSPNVVTAIMDNAWFMYLHLVLL